MANKGRPQKREHKKPKAPKKQAQTHYDGDKEFPDVHVPDKKSPVHQPFRRVSV